VLGPLLFLIYVNDISRVLDEQNLKLFADDTNLFLCGRSLRELEYVANICLEKLQIWFLANKLSLNIDKTCYTVFSSNSVYDVSFVMNLTIGGKIIKRVSSCKYLGVFIDEKLSWDVHIDSIYKKLVKFTSIFYKVRHLLPPLCLTNLYYAFIYPHIIFGVEVYANTHKCKLDKLSKLNNKLMRIILSKKICTPVAELHKLMNVLPISDLHEMRLMLFVHKCIYHRESLPEIFHDYFTSMHSVHSHNTRRNSDLCLTRMNSMIGQRYSLYKCCKLWNLLPSDVKVNSSVVVFKRNVVQFLLYRNM
jgi:hypothetical protein